MVINEIIIRKSPVLNGVFRGSGMWLSYSMHTYFFVHSRHQRTCAYQTNTGAMRLPALNVQKMDMVVIRVLMMCGWISLLTLTNKWPA